MFEWKRSAHGGVLRGIVVEKDNGTQGIVIDQIKILASYKTL